MAKILKSARRKGYQNTPKIHPTRCEKSTSWSVLARKVVKIEREGWRVTPTPPTRVADDLQLYFPK